MLREYIKKNKKIKALELILKEADSFEADRFEDPTRNNASTPKFEIRIWQRHLVPKFKPERMNTVHTLLGSSIPRAFTYPLISTSLSTPIMGSHLLVNDVVAIDPICGHLKQKKK